MVSCPSARTVTARALLSFFAISCIPPVAASPDYHDAQQAPLIPFLPPPPSASEPTPKIVPREHDFTLRHIVHKGTNRYPDLHRRMNIAPDALTIESVDGWEEEGYPTTIRVASHAVVIQRLRDRSVASIKDHLTAARYWGKAVSLDASEWTTDEILGPNVTDKTAVLGLSQMAANSYAITPHEGEWEDIGHGFNHSGGFGWESDGLRGYLYTDKDNSTLVMAIKGTTPAVFDGAETTTNDKINDNLMGSCCCGQGGQYLWHQACDCYTKAFTCNQTCLVKALRSENMYYKSAIELYGNVTELYPNSTIWLVGHSLGGAVSGLLAQTFGVPAVTFEAYGEALTASRLGLPLPPTANGSAPYARSDSAIYHFGHTADPIYMGLCNGATSACTLGGYALETKCHSGHYCQYDTVADYGWRVGVGYHSIRRVIKDVIRVYDGPAVCKLDTECFDCTNWIYFESNSSETTTSKPSTTSTSYTRTATCQTPGWWGCLDESTTSAATETRTSTTTLTSATCKSYGWFGACLDPVTSTTISTTTIPPPTTTTSSKNSAKPTTETSTSTCMTPGVIYGCKDKTTSTATQGHAMTAAPRSIT
ncbi:putative lipase atg15 [Bachmanniomyces sp. S44760]|nr:putative lipase atg15 [Bachmanniomyces sp. S44760]